MVEGSQIYDAEFEAIAVFATNVTTKLLQQAKRQQQQQERYSVGNWFVLL